MDPPTVLYSYTWILYVPWQEGLPHLKRKTLCKAFKGEGRKEDKLPKSKGHSPSKLIPCNLFTHGKVGAVNAKDYSASCWFPGFFFPSAKPFLCSIFHPTPSLSYPSLLLLFSSPSKERRQPFIRDFSPFPWWYEYSIGRGRYRSINHIIGLREKETYLTALLIWRSISNPIRPVSVR